MRRCARAVGLALGVLAVGCERVGPVPAPSEPPAAAPFDAAPPKVAAPAVPSAYATANLLPCPWDADAVAPLLGARANGTSATYNTATSYTVHCSYVGPGGRVLELDQSWYAPDAARAAFARLDRQLGTARRPLEGDADGAAWVEAGPDRLELVYTRANVRVALRLRGIGADDTALRHALLALPRVPG